MANNTQKDGKHNDYIAKTMRVITSKTIYKSALERNIDAFFQAVETEEEMQGVKQEMARMRRDYADMKKDYTDRLDRMEQLILSLVGRSKKEKRQPILRIIRGLNSCRQEP